jgi:hypothetical protein
MNAIFNAFDFFVEENFQKYQKANPNLNKFEIHEILRKDFINLPYSKK